VYNILYGGLFRKGGGKCQRKARAGLKPKEVQQPRKLSAPSARDMAKT